ncbi:MAG: DUF2341 domain-containing protein [Candidatus Paceibacterota bacterium]
MQINKFKKAFTLIELLVVIAIVGILAGFIFVSVSGALNSAQDAKIKADMATVQKAIMEYAALNNGAYPATLSALVPTYLGVIPANPIGGSYTYTNLITSFTLSGTLTSGLPWAYNSATNSWNSGFAYGQYKKVITIINNPSSSVIAGAYPVKLIIDTSALIPANMRTDCNDLRFSDSSATTNLSYWIESGCNTSSTIVWVNLPNGIPANTGTTINMYYGTQTAAASSGSFFTFFDDFTNPVNSINTSNWAMDAGSAVVSGGILNLQNVSWCHQIISPTGVNYAYRMRVNSVHAGSAGGTQELFGPAPLGSAWGATIAASHNGVNAMYDNFISSHNTSAIIGNSANTYGVYEVKRDNGTQNIYTLNDANSKTISTQTFVNTNGVIYLMSWTNGSQLLVDWTLVRPYSSAEPIIGPSNFGTETTGQ